MSRTATVLAVAVAVAVAVGATLAGCGAGGSGSGPTTATTAAPATATGGTAATTTSAAYAATTVPVSGARGPLTYDVALPQLSGGDPAMAQAFNDAMHASLQDDIDRYGNDPTGGTTPATLTDARTAVTHIGSRVVSGLLQTALDTGGAHPFVSDGTVVIDLGDGSPITLGALFGDEQAGLQRLSEQVAPLIAAQQPGLQVLPEGIAPTEANYASWQATPEGMQIVFGDYRIGPRGVVAVTVPWSALTDVVDPDVLPVVSS